MRHFIAFLAALTGLGLACNVNERHQLNTKNIADDHRMEELKYSKFCTDAAEKFWNRHDWAARQDLHESDSYTSHYNKKMNKCLVEMHGIEITSDGHKVIESDYIFDALENTVLGGQMLLKSPGQEGAIEGSVLTRDGHTIRDEKERQAFMPWFQSLMVE